MVALAETTPEEARLFRFGQDAMNDNLYEIAETKLQDLLTQFPQTEYREEASLQLAKARLNQGRWSEAISTLDPVLSNTSAKWQDDYLLVIGEAQLKGEIADAALKTFQTYVNRFPKSKSIPIAKYGIARALLLQEKVEAAQEILRLLQKEGGDLSGKATLSLGTSFILQKKYEQAIELLNKLVKEEKNRSLGFQAQYALGELEFEQKQYNVARQKFEALINSEHPEAQSVIPLALMRMGQIEAAIGNGVGASNNYEMAFRRSNEPMLRLNCVSKLEDVYLKLQKEDALADKIKGWAEEYEKSWLGESLFLEIGTLWQRAGKRDPAIKAYQNFIERFPKSRLIDRARFQLGWVFLEDKKYETASAEFQKAIEGADKNRNPQLQADALLKLGDLNFERQEYQQAAQAYLKSSQIKGIESSKSEQALYQAAHAQLKLGHTSEVLKLHSNYSSQFSGGTFAPEFLMVVADAYRKAGESQKVADTYGSILEKYQQSPHLPKAWVLYAESLYALGKFKESVESSGGFLEKFPKNEFTPRVLLNRARCLERLDQLDKAVAEFEGLIRTYPKTRMALEARFWLGCYFDRQKNYAKAQEQFELLRKDAAPNDPLVPEATYFAAVSAYRLGQNKEDASRLLNNLVTEYPNSPWVFDGKFLYADILTEQGNFEGALRLFEDLTKEGATNLGADRILEAHGRRGQCLRQLKKFDDAIAAFKMIVDAQKADLVLRNQAYVELAKTYEVINDYERAVEHYLAPLYERNSVTPVSDTRDFFWVCKGGFEAVRLLEQKKNWKGAAGVLKRMVDSNLPCKKEADERLKNLKAEHADAN
jgi:TolA-binding protein